MSNIAESILEVVNRFFPNKYNSKYNNAYYLKSIMYVLKDVNSWNCLGNMLRELCNVKKFHHKSIYNVFLKWSKANVFKIAYNELLKKTITYNSNSTIDLFIDTSVINNKYGIEDVTYGYIKKKKMSKLSLICDSNKNVLSVSMHPGNIHDTKTVYKSLDNLLEFKYRKINLIADKGYCCDEIKEKLKEKKINYIFPNKKKRTPDKNNKKKQKKSKIIEKQKNEILKLKKEIKDIKQSQKKKKKNIKLKNSKTKVKIIKKESNKKKKDITKKYNKKKLSKRFIIENVNQNIKKYDRISLRKDKSNQSYISNIYLALLLLYPFNNPNIK